MHKTAQGGQHNLTALNKIHWERTKVVPFTCELAGATTSSDFESLSFVSLLKDYPFGGSTSFYVYVMALCLVKA